MFAIAQATSEAWAAPSPALRPSETARSIGSARKADHPCRIAEVMPAVLARYGLSATDDERPSYAQARGVDA